MSTYSSIEFPRAFAFAIDDLGWNEGSDLARDTPGGPHRAGVKRTFDINDYRYIIEVGKAVGVEDPVTLRSWRNGPGEYTRQISHYNPHERQVGQLTLWLTESQVAIMRYVRDEAASIEFGFHGTGHEYWAEDGIPRRGARVVQSYRQKAMARAIVAWPHPGISRNIGAV